MPEPVSSLPAWTYNNEEFFRLEIEHLFRNAWHLVCHQSDIPNEGDYFTFELAGESAAVIRSDGVIRAFHNVCRHRGARILSGTSGTLKDRIRCPYHAWCYGLDGTLTSVPFENEFGGLQKDDYALHRVDIEVCLGFVFIRFGGEGPSVAEQLAPAMDDLVHYQFEKLEPLGRVTLRPRQVNWKQVADNYVDALHIPVAHPGLFSLLGNSYGLEVRGELHRMWGDLRNRPGSLSARLYRDILPSMPHLPEHLRQRWLYYRLWPGLAFDIYPDQIDFMQFIPVSATETLIREIPYGLPDSRRETRLARYLNWRINRRVNAEDTDLIHRVQAGMASPAFTTGPLARTETCLIDSVRRMQAILPVSRLALAPDPGRVRAINAEMSSSLQGSI